MTPNVAHVKPLPDYKLEILFENSQQCLFDMTPYLAYPAFSLLTINNLFMNARVKNGTVTWNDDIDISPDTLYLDAVPLNRLTG